MSEPNKRAIAQQERRRESLENMYRIEEPWLNRRERLENIANQGSASYQEIEPGQSERANQTHTPVPNRRALAQQERR
ncbi:hypothetical protein F8M41_022996 [Gigaspora margarita]|uniref:Uncharacterized protein n=1 Tax=Gigaspora margarita TaxID=4874 RepID=A0A8H4AE66_GIGMA|nr:hypothetical protein F8M41_022996 [Gigaspora margarita]